MNEANFRIVLQPASVLYERALDVEAITDEVRGWVRGMLRVMKEHHGMGLAAPQIGISRRIFVASLGPGFQSELVFINPVVTPVGETEEWGLEGCLSIPGKVYRVRRWKSVLVKGFDLSETPHSHLVSGMASRCVQHEMDHLDGRLISQTGVLHDVR